MSIRDHTLSTIRSAVIVSDLANSQYVWDSGDLACGPMLLELKTRLEKLPAGRVFQLVARDEGAPADLPAWCRLTGHKLIRASHPIYHIERRKD